MRTVFQNSFTSWATLYKVERQDIKTPPAHRSAECSHLRTHPRFLPHIAPMKILRWYLKRFRVIALTNNKQTHPPTHPQTDTTLNNTTFATLSLSSNYFATRILNTYQSKHFVYVCILWMSLHTRLRPADFLLQILSLLNKCIGDDTKAADRQSLNCIKNKK